MVYLVSLGRARPHFSQEQSKTTLGLGAPAYLPGAGQGGHCITVSSVGLFAYMAREAFAGLVPFLVDPSASLLTPRTRLDVLGHLSFPMFDSPALLKTQTEADFCQNAH